MALLWLGNTFLISLIFLLPNLKDNFEPVGGSNAAKMMLPDVKKARFRSQRLAKERDDI